MGEYLKEHSGFYVVIYDISSNKERRKVDKLLKGFGFRIQKSVFECRLKKRDKENLIKKLELLDIKTGFIKIYKEEYCFKNKIIGEKPSQTVDNDNAFIV